MLKLNLLSRERQKTIRQKHAFKRFTEISWVLLFGFISCSIFLFVWSYSAQSQYEILASEEAFLRDSGVADKLKTAKKDSNFVKKAESENVYFSRLLEKVFQASPADLALNTVSVDQSSTKVLISGQAKSRDSLLKFRDSLNNGGFFSKAELPITDLAKQNDIVFSLSVEFNPELLK